MIIILDASPLSLLAQREGVATADACRVWMESLVRNGHRVVIPAIADFEVRRELIRAKKVASVRRLDALRASLGVDYLPISDAVLIRAADLWAQARQAGKPTAAPSELDCDVILAATALTAGLLPPQLVVATTNVGHLSCFLPAQTWQSIQP